MGHAWLVYELKRDGRRVYCSSFAVAAALLDRGWKLSDWGEWKQCRLRGGASAVSSTRDLDGVSVQQPN